MNKLISLSLFLVFFISCGSIKNVSLEKKKVIKTTVNTVLNNWHLAASEANFEAYFGKMDSVSVFIGTDASENWNKKQFQDFSKPYFDKWKAWDFKTLERTIHVNPSGEFVWFDELLNTCIGSGVLEKTRKWWKINHYVLWVTIPNDDVQAVILAKKESDAIFLKKFQK